MFLCSVRNMEQLFIYILRKKWTVRGIKVDVSQMPFQSSLPVIVEQILEMHNALLFHK